MKRYIKFKIKHLLGVMGAALAIVMLSYMLLPSAIYTIAENHYREGEHEVAKVYYERINKYFPRSGKTAEALERSAQLATHDNMLMISPMGIGSANHVRGNLSQEARGYYTELAERFPETFQGRRAIVELTIQEIKDKVNLGKADEAVKIAKEYYNSDSVQRLNFDIATEAAKALRAKGHYREGIDVIEYVLEKRDNINAYYPEVYELLGDLYGAVGEVDEAKYYYDEVLNSLREIESHEREFIVEEDQISRSINMYGEKKPEIERKITALSEGPRDLGTVTGTISLSGKPLSDVQLILQPLPEANVYYMGSQNAIWGMSDSSGEFVFDNIAPGRYGLGFLVDLDRVGDVVLQGGAFPQSTIYVEEGSTHTWDFSLVETMTVLSPIDGVVIEGDTVEFSWEPYPEAAYYTLDLGRYMENGAASSGMHEKYYTNKATLSIEDLRSLQTGISFDDKGPVPESLFGYAMPGGRYFWGVKAHDEDGKILTASRGYLKKQNTDFSFPEEELLAGDRLLLERKYGEAIAAYEETLEEDPNNIHALRMLASLHQVSIRSDFGSYDYTDYDKAASYFGRLYELTGNTEYLGSVAGIYFYSQGEYEKALETLEIIQTKEELTDWQLMMLAWIESHYGNYDEGLRQLLKAEMRFYQLEAALRIITDNFAGISSEGIEDDKERRWEKALEDYAVNYKDSESELLKLSLKLVEPSMRSDTNKNVNNFINNHRNSEPELTQIAKVLFLTQ